jgi:hypothetical protein
MDFMEILKIILTIITIKIKEIPIKILILVNMVILKIKEAIKAIKNLYKKKK